MLQKVVVTFDHLSVHTLSRCVHTIDQVELDSQQICTPRLCGGLNIINLQLHMLARKANLLPKFVETSKFS